MVGQCNMIFNTTTSAEDSMAQLQKATYGGLTDDPTRQGPTTAVPGVPGQLRPDIQPRRLYNDMQHSIDGILGNSRARNVAGSPTQGM